MQQPLPFYPSPLSPPASRPVHWPSVAQLGLSLVAVTLYWGLAASVGLAGIFLLISRTRQVDQVSSMLLLSSGAALAGVPLFFSAVYASLRLMGRRLEDLGSFGKGLSELVEKPLERLFSRPGLLILLLPVVIGLGWLVDRFAPLLAWLVLPLLQLLALSIPTIWLVWLGRRGLPAGSGQRAWGFFSSGLTLVPLILMIAETTAILGIGMVALVWIAMHPAALNELMTLAQKIQSAGNSSEELFRLLSPYLARPGVFFPVLAFLSIIVPLIEEAFKPLALYFFARKGLAPAEGFTGGLLCGAGYALFENLGSTTASDLWTSTVIARLGATMLHILTPALIGWALVLAWKENRYLRLGLVYLGVVITHGSWNALALLTSSSALGPFTDLQKGISDRIGSVGIIGLGLISVLMFVLLLTSNANLHRSLRQRAGIAGEISPVQPS
jgi:hypothetical protein